MNKRYIAIYILKYILRLSVISFALCMDAWTTTIGTLILPFACGVLYGLMSLGKKADSATMAAAASGGGNNYRQFDNET